MYFATKEKHAHALLYEIVLIVWTSPTKPLDFSIKGFIKVNFMILLDIKFEKIFYTLVKPLLKYMHAYLHALKQANLHTYTHSYMFS